MAQFKDTIIDGILTVNGTSVNDALTDYIIESGSTGFWHYRKWASGIAECWTTGEKHATGEITPTALLGGYYTYITLSLPFSFVTIGTIDASGMLGTGVALFCNITPEENKIRLYPVGNQNSNAVHYRCCVRGTWK